MHKMNELTAHIGQHNFILFDIVSVSRTLLRSCLSYVKQYSGEFIPLQDSLFVYIYIKLLFLSLYYYLIIIVNMN